MGTKPRPLHHQLPEGKRRGKRKHFTGFLERMREECYQSDKHGTGAKAILGKLMKDEA